MWLRNYPTKRKLLKDIENLRAENRHLSIELRNARTESCTRKDSVKRLSSREQRAKTQAQSP